MIEFLTRPRRVLIFGLMLLICAPLRADDKKAEANTDATIYQVLYRLSGVYHIVIRAKLNDKGPFNFILDTGFNVVLMTPQTAGQLGLPGSGTQRLDKLEIEGGPSVEKQLINVNTPAQVSMLNRNRSEGCELHGIIGYHVMQNFRIDIDYSTHKMTWTRGGKPPEKDANAFEVPFGQSKTNPPHVIVQGKLNGKGPFRFMFDTGAPGTTISPRTGIGNSKEIVLDTVELGDLKSEKVPAFVMSAPPFEDVDGILGFPFMSRYKVTFDFPRKKLVLSPGTYQPPPVPKSVVNGAPVVVPPDPKGGEWGFAIQKDLTIKDVLPDGPAATAGIEVGDRLLSLDDSWINSEADFCWASVRVKPGTAADLLILRDRKQMRLKVIPRATD